MPFIFPRLTTALRFQPLCQSSPLVGTQTHASGTRHGRVSFLCGSGTPAGPLRIDDFDEEKRGLVHRYLKFLLEENQKYNLTGIGSYDDAIDKLVNDSTVLLPYIDHNVEGDIRLVDVGSGAGIPGIIFGILKPSWKICCIESKRKKSNFMAEAVALCELKNVEIVNGRAEDIGHDPLHREVFDVAVCRGVGSLRVISEYCLPLLKCGGLFVAPKGPAIEVEVNAAASALECLKGSVMKIEQVHSWGSVGQRTVVLIKKIDTTPRKFPRKSGKPNKDPL